MRTSREIISEFSKGGKRRADGEVWTTPGGAQKTKVGGKIKKVGKGRGFHGMVSDRSHIGWENTSKKGEDGKRSKDNVSAVHHTALGKSIHSVHVKSGKASDGSTHYSVSYHVRTAGHDGRTTKKLQHQTKHKSIREAFAAADAIVGKTRRKKHESDKKKADKKYERERKAEEKAALEKMPGLAKMNFKLI